MTQSNLRDDSTLHWRRIAVYLVIGTLAVGLLTLGVTAASGGSDSVSDSVSSLASGSGLNLSEDTEPSADDTDENLSAEGNLTVAWEAEDDADS